MTTIAAKIVEHSKAAETGAELVTFLLKYPRAIHAEFMTHRVFSRNASSSRAIPVKRIIQDVLDDPFIPLHWGKNQKGMQAGEETNARVSWRDAPQCVRLSYTSTEAWLEARDNAVKIASAFDEAGYHKQIVNRLLEPFSHITVVATATSFGNFLALRDHPDAEPHIQILAREMNAALATSTPNLLQPGQWHLPFIAADERVNIGLSSMYLVKASVARCARTSYDNHDGTRPDLASDILLHDRLVAQSPAHASPAEHPATPDRALATTLFGVTVWERPELHGNLTGWRQYRKTLPNEFVPG